MRHPWVTIGFFGLLFVGSLLLKPRVGFELFPRVDEGVIRINLELSSTASLEATDEQVRKVEAFCVATYVKSMSSTVEAGGFQRQQRVIRVYLVDAVKGRAPSLSLRPEEKFAGLPDTNVTINVASGQGGRAETRTDNHKRSDLDVLNGIWGTHGEDPDVRLADLDTTEGGEVRP